MKKSGWIVLLAFALALVSAPAFAQSSNSSSLSGVVVDSGGGVVPGATVVIKNNATGTSLTTVTNKEGVFQFPSLDAGSYSVKITLQSFKTVDYKEVRLLSASAVALPKTVMEIGAMTEMVEVRGTTDLIRTQSPTVSMTVTGEFIENLPRSTRNALDFTIFLPGVSTTGGNQNSRSSTIAGLPQNTINITMDGITTSNLLMSGDGFFTMVTPRLDAVEEVTLTTAAAGADASGQGSTQIRFVTRSGTNQYQTSLYDYFQNKAFNTNTFFNQLNGLPRVRRTTDVYGGRIGGPIVIPGLYDGHGKAFFFFNQENNWAPNQAARNRTVANDATVAGTTNMRGGDWTYNTSTIPLTVNVLTFAASKGISTAMNTPDPTVADVLLKIKAATGTTGNLKFSTATPNVSTYSYLIDVASLRYSPTTRVDLNLTPHHRLSGSYYLQRYKDNPDTLNNADPTFPTLPARAAQNSYRTTGSSTLRSTFGTNIVNELLVGWQHSPNEFFTDATNAMFTDPGMDTKGYFFTLGAGLTNPAPGAAQTAQPRNTPNIQVNDSVNWLKGDHSFKFGTEFTRIVDWQDVWTNANGISFGLSTNVANADPAATIFSAANFPTATSTDLSDMRALYGLITGRIPSFGGTGRLSQDGTTYVYNGHAYRKERQDEWGFFASDSWRLKPNVTLSLGLRYEVQMSMVGITGTFTQAQMSDACGMSGLGNGFEGRQCNLFQPGVIGDATFKPTYNGTAWVPSSVPAFTQFTPGSKGYNLDLNNFAPSVGVNWRPVVKSGFMRKLLGDPESATVSGAFARTFNHERVDEFLNVFGNNPGNTTPVGRGFGNTTFLLNPLDQHCITASLQAGFVVGTPVDGVPCDPSKQNASPLLFSQRTFGSAAGGLVGGGDPNALTNGPGYTYGTLGPLTTPLGVPFVSTAVGQFGTTGKLNATTGNTVFVFDPKIQVPYTDSWTAGLQRSLSRDMAIEFRYIGNVNKQPWTQGNGENWNGANYRETGLIGPNTSQSIGGTPGAFAGSFTGAGGTFNDYNSDQFIKAMTNLELNVAAGKGATFKYDPTVPGTLPLPLFMNHIAGALDATVAANYSSTAWSATAFTGNMNPFSPSPQGVANTLSGTAAYLVNAINTQNSTGAPGIYPANFWIMNPAVNNVQVTRNQGSSRYNALQVDLRRRFSKGFQADFSYTYARTVIFSNIDLHQPLYEQRGQNIPHALKMIWVWDLPVGRGRRFGTNMSGWLNNAIGGWQFSGTGRIQVPLLRLSNTLIFGMSQADAQKMLKSIYMVRDSTSGATTVRDMPQDVIDNTIKAYSASVTNVGYWPTTAATFNAAGTQLTAATVNVPTGRYFAPARRPAGLYSPTDPGCGPGLANSGPGGGLFQGDCAPDMFFYGNWFGEYDLKFLKKFQLPKKVQFEMDVEIFNALNATNFSNNLNPGAGSTIFRVTGQGSGAATGAGRTAQLLWRVSW